MRINRVVIRNFRSFECLDVSLDELTTCIIGENNTGKSNFLHAIRLCIDATLSSTFRALAPNDLFSEVDISEPNQVLIGLEITDFTGKVNEEALVGAWQIERGRARLIYRFRPKLAVREDLEDKEIEPGDLKLSDYQWEIVGGGDLGVDLTDIEWNDDIGASIRFSDLQSFLVVFLPALRDVETELRNFRSSPLARLIDVMEIDDDEKKKLLDILRNANDAIQKSKSIKEVADAIDKSFKSISGPAFSMDVDLGLAEPSFQAIVRALRILLSNVAMDDFDPSSNGLGLNNILYVAILTEYFNKRIAQKKTAGQIILFEEPEAHLHPQLQLVLFKALCELPFQTILTTHSTQITSNANFSSYVILTQTGSPAIKSCVPAKIADLEPGDVMDLERYLDATKSGLLFARKVILVEGPAEVFLIPPLVKHVLNVDLEREGISVIPIYGVHFDVYAKLFSDKALPKKCALVTDGDLVPSDADPDLAGEDDLPAPPNLAALENDFVKVFACKTTFERALVSEGTLEMFAQAAEDIGAPNVALKLRNGLSNCLVADAIGKSAILTELRKTVLNTAKRFGKARFAQIAATRVDQAQVVPQYLIDCVNWLQK